jgi:F-type H+-transporting ATPase subunit b
MAEPTAHTEAPAGHGAFPPFQSEFFPSQLFWLGVSFVLLYVLMSKLALPRVGSIIEARSERIAEDLKAAEGFRTQSDAAQSAYEKSLADARARAQGIASSTREEQAAKAAENNKRLEAELNAKLAAAEQSIAKTRSAAMDNVGSIAADTASAIVERLIGKAPADNDVKAALSDVLKR